MKKLTNLVLCAGMILTLGACGAGAAKSDPVSAADAVSEMDSEHGTDAESAEEPAYEIAVRIRINPEMILYLDKDHVVVGAEMVNRDAEELYAPEDLVGRPYGGALEYVVNRAVEKGYADENDARVDVFVDHMSEEADCGFVLEEAKTIISGVAEEHNMTIMALTNEVDIGIWQQYEAENAEDMPDFCGVCGGTGICKNCHGTRKLLCGECYGAKETACARCGGAGNLSGTCERCQGSGREVCPRCQGTGSMVCARCRGTLIQACEWCQGDGKNHVTTTHDGRPLPPDEYDPVCSKCKGTGTKVCRDCDNGYTPCESDKGEKCEDGMIVCELCGGAGSLEDAVCGACEGNGLIVCVACEGNGETSCPYCSGSGMCADCEGTGIR